MKQFSMLKATALGVSAGFAIWARTTAAAGFALVEGVRVTPIMVAEGEPEYVRLAAEDLASDVERITGLRPEVRIGTGGGDVRVEIRTKTGGSWESYRVAAYDGRLLIEGGDARGTMFGVYAFIEEYLKVDPLWFWSGREPVKSAELKWDDVALVSGTPDFRFRGWFINDEDFLTEWMESGGTRNIDYRYYKQVVNREAMRAVAEALVRSRFNLIIPASFIDILNPPERALVEECARRGVFVSQHHVEPMGVSAFAYFNYWKARGKDLKYSFFSHPEEVREVWRTYAAEWAKIPNVIWQIGLRGIADRPMWQADPSVPQADADRGRIISEAMAEQVRILDEIYGDRPRLISTTLWAEGSVLNQKGHLAIPEGTIMVFSDNSPGWKWPRDFYETPRRKGNTYGVYYHHALFGSGPHLAQVVPPHKTYELLWQAFGRQSAEYAIFNVSNIREFVLGIDATAKMTWRMDGFDPDAWLTNWVSERFTAHRRELTDAYRIYFNAYELHDRHRVPSLMDGQMFQMGSKNLIEMGRKIRDGRIGTGAAEEAIRYVKKQDKVPEFADSFYESLSNMHPQDLTRREYIRRLEKQRTGFMLALLHARSSAPALPESEARFLHDNLIYQAAIMERVCFWLGQVLCAHEALDLGNRDACQQSMDAAAAAFAEIPELAKGYCIGKWEHWYRGCKKLNITEMQKRTCDVAEAHQKAGR